MMFDTSNDPKCKTAELRHAFYAGQHWRHILPPDVDWREPLRASYWRDVLRKFMPGDPIDVATADFSLVYQLLVCEVQDVAGYIRLQARPLFPHDFELPPVVNSMDRPRYGIQVSPQGGGNYCVVDLQTGEIVRNPLDRIAANDLAYSRNEADRVAKESQAAKTDLAVLSAATEIAAGMEKHKQGSRK